MTVTEKSMINEKATSCMLVAFSYRESCTGSAHSSPSFGGIEGGLHLGNTVVLFEDKSGDNVVTNDEVIQRYYYYK